MTTIEGLRDIRPYVANSQLSGEDLIRLNTDGNAYRPSPKVAEVFPHFDVHQLRKYSTLNQESLRVVSAKQHGLDSSQIVVGNGSDDVLSTAFLAFFNSDEPVLSPDLIYGFYKVWAGLYRINCHEVPLASDFRINGNDHVADNDGIVLTSPNAPTDICRPLEAIEVVTEANQDAVVIIGEAYINFGGEMTLPLLEKYDDVFITRTFPKGVSLTGLRVGYGMGSPELMSVINAVKGSINLYNVDLIAERLAVVAVESQDYYEDTYQRVIATRDWFTKELRDPDFSVLKLKTSFVLTEYS